MKIAFGIVLGVVLLIGGCVALLGVGASSVSDDINKAVKDASTNSGSTAAGSGKAKNFAKGDAQGEYAIAQAAGSVSNPGEIRVKVSSSPPQEAMVTWTMNCSKGTGVGAKSGQFSAGTPIRRALPKPQKAPDNCEVSANVQLKTGGKVNLALAG